MHYVFYTLMLAVITGAQNYNRDCVYANSRVSCGRVIREQAVSSLDACIALCNNSPITCAGADYRERGYVRTCQLFSGPILPYDPSYRPPRLSSNNRSNSHEMGGARGGRQRGRRQSQRHTGGRDSRDADRQCSYLPARVIGGCTGVTHYRPNCNGGATTQYTTTTPLPTTTSIFLPAGTICPIGTQARYVLLEDVAINDAMAAQFNAASLQQCLQACTDNRLPDGRQAACQSIDYRAGVCRLNTDTLRPEGSGTLQPSPGNSFYEKICVTPANDRQCPGPYYLAPNHVLYGFAQIVVDARSFEQCMQHCVNSRQQYDFDCRSGLFYYTVATENCILNYETKDTQPTLYTAIDESTEQVDYFEPRCQNDAPFFAVAGARQDLPIGVTMARAGQLSAESTWGTWSSCNSESGLQTRYRQCNQLDVKKCQEKETRACTSTTQSKCSPMTACCATLAPSGEKDCQRGIRLGADMRRIECTPTDC